MADLPMRPLLVNLLPPFMKQFREFREILRIEEKEIELLETAISRVLDAGFLDDCDEYSISRYENIYGLSSKATDTLDDRRFRIRAKLNEQQPYTLRNLRKILANLCGAGNYSVEITAGTYNLTVKVGLAAKNNYNAVEDLLQRIVPANMVIGLSMLYNTYAVVGRYTHAQLSQLTHNQIRSEVMDNA